MKSILTISILAATGALAFADEKPVAERARDAASGVVDKTKEVARDATDAVVGAAYKVGNVTRGAWKKTKAAVSEDPIAFREGATQTLRELGREIGEVKTTAPTTHPAYFRTRLQALDQQHEHLNAMLAKLTPEQIKVRMSGARHAFDESVEDLEDAIDQARKEAKTLARVSVK
jgi:gas vesicle protein